MRYPVLHIWILTPVSIGFTKFKRISVYFFLYHHLNNYSGRLLIIKFCNYYFVYLFLEMATYNPWHVDSIQSFWFLRCPECPFDTKEEYIFQDHAIENHPSSFSLFGKTLEWVAKTRKSVLWLIHTDLNVTNIGILPKYRDSISNINFFDFTQSYIYQVL